MAEPTTMLARSRPLSAADDARFGIGEISARSGVAQGTLRVWESRYGFPEPRRLPSGHRRYSEADLERVRAVARAREAGLPLPVAIRRARTLAADPQPSLYAALRQRFPYLHPRAASKPTLLAISRAIEDECTSRALNPLLLAGFQRERFYRQAQARWTELARTAERAIVLADFARIGRPRGAPAEVPLGPADPLMREWILVCHAAELSACLVGWERPPVRRASRRLEFIWSAEPHVVHEAARQSCKLIARGPRPGGRPARPAGRRTGTGERRPPARHGGARDPDRDVRIGRGGLSARAAALAPFAGVDECLAPARWRRVGSNG